MFQTVPMACDCTGKGKKKETGSWPCYFCVLHNSGKIHKKTRIRWSVASLSSTPLLSARRRHSRSIAGWVLLRFYSDGCRVLSTLLPMCRLVLLAEYDVCTILLVMSPSDDCVCLSAQLLLVVFDLGYDLSFESFQLSRIEPLYYNKQYSLRHYGFLSPPKYTISQFKCCTIRSPGVHCFAPL